MEGIIWQTRGFVCVTRVAAVDYGGHERKPPPVRVRHNRDTYNDSSLMEIAEGAAATAAGR